MDKNLFVRTVQCLGVASASLLLGLPALAQSQLNPNPSIFNEAPYSRTRGLTIDQTQTNNLDSNRQMNNSGMTNDAGVSPNESGQQQPSTAPERNRTSSDDPRVFTPGSQPGNSGVNNTNRVPNTSPSGTESPRQNPTVQPDVNSGTTDRQRSIEGGSTTIEQRTRTQQIQQQTSPGVSSPAGSSESSPGSGTGAFDTDGSAGQAVQGLW
jgi:hypothetical protein